MKQLALAVAALVLPAVPAIAQQAPKPETTERWPEASFEIFKLAPGKQEDFIRHVAQLDAVEAAGGQPPIQLFFHESGSDFDVIVFKTHTDSKPTAAQEAAMAAKRKELGIKSGPAYFLGLRQLVAAHHDSRTYGPLSPAEWLARLDQSRAEGGK